MASIVPQVKLGLEQAENTLDNLMDVFDENTLNMINRIDVFILDQLQALERNPDGRLVSTEVNIARAINSRTALINFSSAQVTGLAEGWTAVFDDVNDFVISNLNSYNVPAAFTQIDAEILNVLKSSTLQEFKSGTDFVFQDMGQDLMEQVLVGGDFRELVSRIKNRLSEKLLDEGIELATGRSLAAQAMRIGHDSLMSTYATMHFNKAEEAGLEKYVYLGPRDRVTRSFCRDRVNRLWTKKQIMAWNNITWRGKISGVDIFVSRGGYNCRHHFQAVPDAIDADDLGLPKNETSLLSPDRGGDGGDPRAVFEKNLRDFERAIAGDAFENAATYDIDGNRIGIAQGSAGRVTIPGIVGLTTDQVRRRKLLVTHNHPSNSSFSAEDIFAAHDLGLRELRAVGSDFTYVMRPVRGLSQFRQLDLSFDEFQTLYDNASNQAILDVVRDLDLSDTGNLDRISFGILVTEETSRILAGLLGYEFVKARTPR